jgi:predicted short-subunit dehydrogenase-like oxidoreductase (DUF2520 family)
MKDIKKLGIIGCGKVGRVLARRLVDSAIVEVSGVVNQTLTSAQDAAKFMGHGTPLSSINEMPQSDVIMIASSDDRLAECAQAVADARIVTSDTIVFHCSGAYSSEVLSPIAALGASTGTVHPMKSFAEPQSAYETFAGTYLGIEGDSRCLNFMEESLTKCGGEIFKLAPETKLLYHAGAVFVCNYMTALIETGLRCFEQAGLDRELALRIIAPFIDKTLNNNMKLGPAKALTGPIARGDHELVKQQYQAVKQYSPLAGEIYAALAKVAAELVEVRAKYQ